MFVQIIRFWGGGGGGGGMRLGESCVCPNNPVLGGGRGEICLYKRHETNTWQLNAPGFGLPFTPIFEVRICI